MNTKTNQHNYGIELLRIVAMLMIVAHHFSLHSGIVFEVGSINDMWMQALALSGKTGVNIFVLITGHYASARIRSGKVLGLIGCTSGYSLVLTAAAVLTGSVGFSMKMLLKAAVPYLFGGTYWFVTTYLELYVLLPVLNMMMERLDSRNYRNYLILFTGLLCVLPKVVGQFIHVNDLGFNKLVWFVYLYFLGAYLKKLNISGKTACCAAIGCVIAQITSCVMLRLGMAHGAVEKLLACMADYSVNAVFPLLISATMLLWFRNVNIRTGRKLLGLFGSATLGVYLFHDHIVFRGQLWSAVYRLITGIGIEFFGVNALLSVVFVFLVGSGIEICRMTLAQKIQNAMKERK